MNEEPQEIESAEDLIETLVPGLSRAEYDQIRSDAIEKGKSLRHAWVMKGRGRLTCTSCEIPHVSYVPMNKLLVGIDEDGKPLLKNG